MTCAMSHLTWALPRNRSKTVPSHLPVFHWHLDYSQWQEYHHGQSHHTKYSYIQVRITELDHSWPGSCNSGFLVFFWTCNKKESIICIFLANRFLVVCKLAGKINNLLKMCAQSFWLMVAKVPGNGRLQILQNLRIQHFASRWWKWKSNFKLFQL